MQGFFDNKIVYFLVIFISFHNKNNILSYFFDVFFE